MFQTLRGKLVFSFSLFLALLLAVIAIDAWSRNWRSKIYDAEQNLNKIRINLSAAKQLEGLFFKDETFNPSFYDQGYSQYLEDRSLLMNQLVNDLKMLQSAGFATVMEHDELIEETIQQFADYETNFAQLVELVKQRGFKDWGIEGEMRNAIHAVEVEKSLDLAKVLMLRRHEKDFIIRKDTKYVKKLHFAVSKLKDDIIRNTSTDSDRVRLLSLVDSYQDKFNQLVRLDQQIGFDNQSGLRNDLQQLSGRIHRNIIKINRGVLDEIHHLNTNTRVWSVGLTAFLVLFGVFMTFSMSKSLGKPITDLSNSIREAVQSGFDQDLPIPKLNTNDEITRLSNDFIYMQEQLKTYLLEIKAKSEKIETKQKQLIDSLRYAEQIQEAILPTTEDLNSYFENHFVIYRPSQVVSGDFYWVTRRKSKIFIGVADCTGHGVPGAFMSMIGHSLLNKIVVQSKVLDPAVILDVLHLEVQAALQQGKGKMNEDGMDVAICSIELGSTNQMRKITFAGARQGLAYTDDNTMTYIPGTKRSIGGKRSARSTKAFETHHFEIKQGEKLYLFSDGFADQHNLQGEKYGKKTVLKLLTHVSAAPFDSQKNFLLEELETHQQTQEQRDDITVLGVKI
ncbi:MAG: SpoIIE family protein phosphatase [Flammeovirgaceae bacterium]